MIWASYSGEVVFVNSPQALQEILTKDKSEYEVPALEVLKPIVGEYSILMLSGDRHDQERKLLTPPFHGQRMGNYGEFICNITKEAACKLTISKTFQARHLME